MSDEKFGRYVIKEVIGRGGMATVYLALDPRFGREVALKVMSSAFQADPTFRGRFEREARTIAALEHPAIVPVYDFGEDNNQLYLVMRHMRGGSLAERIIRGPLSLDEALPIIKPIASALDHAHKRGIIHRDLKPGNILFDEYGNAFLSDFGIVKVSEATSSLTGSGVIGTPAYMSPEQVHGDQAIDGRSDIYTLGIILFEMITGHKPFRADTPVKLMMAHVLNPVPSILDSRPDLPVNMDDIIQKTLSKKPDERFANGHALAEALTMTMTSLQKPPVLSSPDKAVVDPVVTDLPTVVGGNVDGEAPPISEMKTAVLSPDALRQIRQKRPSRWPWLLGGLVGLAAIAVVLILNFRNGAGEATPTLEPTPVPTTVVAVVVVPTGTPTMTPTATATATATQTPPATPTSTSTPSRTPTPTPTPVRELVGRSVNDVPIEAVGFGSGENIIVLIGGLHAGFAPATVDLAEQAIAYFAENAADIPENVQIYIIANANPDSPLDPGNLPGRLNANSVDLNRNWDCRWQQDVQVSGQLVPGGGGTAPFSEPEVLALSAFLLDKQPTAVIFWEARAADGLVSPGSCEATPKASRPLADVYGAAAGYPVRDFEILTQQVVNGDSTNWLDDQEIPAISVLVPEYAEVVDWEQNLTAVLAVIEAVAGE
ncbi:MAG: protein kinase [Ardenticatenaceae bacterium]|nr:protein kinase [Ardenticatenaceae bacterium]